MKSSPRLPIRFFFRSKFGSLSLPALESISCRKPAIDGSIFAHGGFDINDRLQWNFEGRLFMSELGEIENNYALMTGIRYFWKR